MPFLLTLLDAEVIAKLTLYNACNNQGVVAVYLKLNILLSFMVLFVI